MYEAKNSVCRYVVLIAMLKENINLLETWSVAIISSPTGTHEVIDIRGTEGRFAQDNLKIKIIFSIVVKYVF